MKKLIIFITIFLYAFVEPKSISHRSIVNDIKIINNKIYSVSNDNTLKVWNKSLNIQNTIYEKQNGNFGNLYTIANNKNYILTAGIVGYDNVIFVHNKKTLKVVKVLRHDFNGINKLKFSPNKNILVVVSGDNLYFYGKNLHFLFYADFYDYSNGKYIYDVTFLNKHTVAFVNWRGYIIIYDIKNKKILKTKQLDTKLQSINFINHKLYVGGYDGYLYIFDKNLKLIKKIFIDFEFEILHIKHSKNYIALAGGNGGFAVLKNDKLLFKKDIGFSKAIDINNEDIYVAHNQIISHYYLDTLINNSKTIIYKPSSITIKSPYFSLNYKDIYNNFIGSNKKSKYHKIDNEWYSYEILNNTLNVYKDNTKVLRDIAISLGGDGKLVLSNKQKIATFIRTPSTGYRHRVVVWYKHYIISGGDYGHVFIYDIKSKKQISQLDNLTDHILDLNIKNNILAVLDEKGDIKLYNLKYLSTLIKPYLTITLFKDKTFLLRSENYFYTNDITKAICLKPTQLNLMRVKCNTNKNIIQQIINSKKPYEKNLKTINLTSNMPLKLDVEIDNIFNTSKYIILGDNKYYALNKKTKQLKKLNLPYGRTIADILQKDGYIYILLQTGNIYKFDENLNYISKTTFRPDFGDSSKYLSIYKKDFIAFRYKKEIYVFDKNLNLKYSIKIPVKNLYYWTFIDNVLYFNLDDYFIKYNLYTKKYIFIKGLAYLKTTQNKFIIHNKNYYLVDKNLNKKLILKTDKLFDFYKAKKYFYAINDNHIIKFLNDKLIKSNFLKKNISSLNGVGEIGNKVVLVIDNKLMLFDFNTNKLKLLLKPVKNINKIYVGRKYIIGKANYYLIIFNKNLKFIKTIKIGYDDVYKLEGNKLYMKGDKNYLINLKTFKITNLNLPKKSKNKKIAYYSDTDGYIYYKTFSTKEKERILNIFITNKYIVAIGIHNVFVYDKKLNLIEKIILDKRVYSYGIFVTKDNNIYYAIYDRIFKYKIDF